MIHKLCGKSGPVCSHDEPFSKEDPGNCSQFILGENDEICHVEFGVVVSIRKGY